MRIYAHGYNIKKQRIFLRKQLINLENEYMIIGVE